MKTYGANKATEFSKKQINVIYGMAKRAELSVEKWVIREFYNLADYYGFDDNRSVEASERKIMNILEAVFANDLVTAQAAIDEYTTSTFEKFGRKVQATLDRSLMA